MKYLYYWGLNGLTPEKDAQRWLYHHALKEWRREPISMREYCVILKETGERMGDASVEIVDESTAEIGWILLPRFRGQGYATEAGRAMMDYGFRVFGKDRVIAHCDARNAASYRVMSRLGMGLEGIEKEVRPAKEADGVKGDEATYSIRRCDWGMEKYRQLSCRFDGFMPLPDLTDGEIRLVCQEKRPAIPERHRVPCYQFLITLGSESVGHVTLRLAYPDSLFYGGQIGYSVDEAYRGRGFAGRACKLLRPVMAYHGMELAVITNNVTNAASRRVCEKLGTEFWGRAEVPADHEMRREEGIKAVNIFAFPVAENP